MKKLAVLLKPREKILFFFTSRFPYFHSSVLPLYPVGLPFPSYTISVPFQSVSRSPSYPYAISCVYSPISSVAFCVYSASRFLRIFPFPSYSYKYVLPSSLLFSRTNRPSASYSYAADRSPFFVISAIFPSLSYLYFRLSEIPYFPFFTFP